MTAGAWGPWDPLYYRSVAEKIASIQADYVKSMQEAQGRVEDAFNEGYKRFVTAVQAIQADFAQGAQEAYQGLLKTAGQGLGQSEAQAQCLTSWQGFVAAINDLYTSPQARNVDRAYADFLLALSEGQGAPPAGQRLADSYQRLQQSLLDLWNQEAVKGKLQQSYSDLAAKLKAAADDGHAHLVSALQSYWQGLQDALQKTNANPRIESAVRDFLASLANVSQQAQDLCKDSAMKAVQQIQDATKEPQTGAAGP